MLSGFGRDDETVRDLRVRQSGRDEIQHFPLAGGEFVALAARRASTRRAKVAQERCGFVGVAAGAEALERVAGRLRAAQGER